ncbi:MAG: hypothetical protein IPL40_10845 [Proteobacteria bacterium]|nr:hypothetical protein [Pseudomonadota bacterium]
MAFLYGDSTPFPLEENFIDTLRNATDICIALLRADEALDGIQRSVEEEQQAAERDLRGVERLVTSVNQVLEPQVASSAGSSYVQGVCGRLLQTAQSVVDNAAKDVVARRDAAVRQAESKMAAERARIPQALERFLLAHEIPGTQWSISWITRRGTTQQTQGPTQANAWALARTPIGLEATFELDVGQSPLWARPFKLGDLKQEVAIQLPHKGGWLDRGTSLREERLDRMFVTEVNLTPQRASVVLRRGVRPLGPGYELTISPDGKAPPEIKPIGEEGAAASDDKLVLEGLDAAAISDLWTMIEARLLPLVGKRVRLAQALLEGLPLAEIKSPAKVAQTLIHVTAPFVREMGRRSPVPGELVLKRQVEDGRREEMFISIRELTDKFATLTPERQSFFGEYGLVFDVREAAPADGGASASPATAGVGTADAAAAASAAS